MANREPKVVTLSGEPVDAKPVPVASVVAALKEALQLAEAGATRGLFIVTEDDWIKAGSFDSSFGIIGALEAAKFDVLTATAENTRPYVPETD